MVVQDCRELSFAESEMLAAQLMTAMSFFKMCCVRLKQYTYIGWKTDPT